MHLLFPAPEGGSRCMYQRMFSMQGPGDSAKWITAVVPPAMVTSGVLLLSLLPGQMLVILVMWTLASFPIGILIGHCVLNDE
jgi:hypothetical protein